ETPSYADQIGKGLLRQPALLPRLAHQTPEVAGGYNSVGGLLLARSGGGEVPGPGDVGAVASGCAAGRRRRGAPRPAAGGGASGVSGTPGPAAVPGALKSAADRACTKSDSLSAGRIVARGGDRLRLGALSRCPLRCLGRNMLPYGSMDGVDPARDPMAGA